MDAGGRAARAPGGSAAFTTSRWIAKQEPEPKAPPTLYRQQIAGCGRRFSGECYGSSVSRSGGTDQAHVVVQVQHMRLRVLGMAERAVGEMRLQLALVRREIAEGLL